MIIRLFDILVPKENKVLRSLLAAAAGIAVFVFLVDPLLKNNADLDRKISESTREYQGYHRILQRAAQIEEEYRRTASGADIPGDQDPLIFSLKTLEELASRYNIKILDIKQSASGSEAKPAVVIDLLMEGKKQDYVKFIYELANGKQLFYIRRCDFKGRENSSLLEAKFIISYSLAR